jgi:hypothetical protein
MALMTQSMWSLEGSRFERHANGKCERERCGALGRCQALVTPEECQMFDRR